MNIFRQWIGRLIALFLIVIFPLYEIFTTFQTETIEVVQSRMGIIPIVMISIVSIVLIMFIKGMVWQKVENDKTNRLRAIFLGLVGAFLFGVVWLFTDWVIKSAQSNYDLFIDNFTFYKDFTLTIGRSMLLGVIVLAIDHSLN
jgi:hypothetical protein